MRLTLLGTGVRTPFVLHGLTERQSDLDLDEVILHDSDAARLRVMARFGAFLCEEWGAQFEVIE